jgi:hypothetical protein
MEHINTEEIMSRVCGRYVDPELYERAQDAARDAGNERLERESEDWPDDEEEDEEPLSADNLK